MKKESRLLRTKEIGKYLNYQMNLRRSSEYIKEKPLRSKKKNLSALSKKVWTNFPNAEYFDEEIIIENADANIPISSEFIWNEIAAMNRTSTILSVVVSKKAPKLEVIFPFLARAPSRASKQKDIENKQDAKKLIEENDIKIISF